MGLPMRLKLTHEGLLVKLATMFLVIYQAFFLDVAQGHVNGASNETETYS